MIDLELTRRLLDGALRADGGPFPVEAIARHYHAELHRRLGAETPDADVVIANALILTDLLRRLGLLEGLYHGNEVGTPSDGERLTENGKRFLALLDDPRFVEYLGRQPLRGDRDTVLEAIRRFSV
ncbi:hypothetical protein NOX82_16820 [Pseudomonas citronellolis]|uniref:hypothetical protein n=1 Tax=Pseudomonas citronellolis TaxID=53408 RepID=UPI002112EC66|nr:hypothetical protein [Pseudomonas citronellolis]UUC47576.1 hypothetical protein NOX82_16820 [Pseudomonas citronellolis]